MQKHILKNGITLIFEKTSSKSVAVEIMFKIGSNYENLKVAGISHFLEHMLFEGTKKRKTSREIANEIEKYGGDFNAYTTGDRTAFFIKIINKKFDVALDILSDMVKNPVFGEKIMQKEKQVILKEINMVNDDPRLFQWILFQHALFEKHPAGNPTYGTAETVKAITRNQLVDYYATHYIPNNMIISVAGNVNNVRKKIERYFHELKPKKIITRAKVNEPAQNRMKKVVRKKKTLNSYTVLGYKAVPRMHKDSYVFDVITAILGRGQSGWMFDEIRNKRGLAYQVGINNESEIDYGMFAVYTNLDKKNIGKAKEIIMQQFHKLMKVTKLDIDEAKTFIEGNHTLQMEDNFHCTDNFSFWDTIKDAKLADSYINNIKKITAGDVKRISAKYFTDKYTLVVIEQE
ncbi:MAG TPA: pitrilysin family protein [Candidatus Nanoarchaeia archaeon]|nr:pitrilysin family protein [Candidatus Nanoarchaeia archaeon]